MLQVKNRICQILLSGGNLRLLSDPGFLDRTFGVKRSSVDAKLLSLRAITG